MPGCRKASKEKHANRLSRLLTLPLSIKNQSGDASLRALASAACATRLTTLNLSGCKLVTDAGVQAVVRACGGVTALDLTRNGNISEASLAEVADGMPDMRELRLYACAGLEVCEHNSVHFGT